MKIKNGARNAKVSNYNNFNKTVFQILILVPSKLPKYLPSSMLRNLSFGFLKCEVNSGDYLGLLLFFSQSHAVCMMSFTLYLGFHPKRFLALR